MDNYFYNTTANNNFSDEILKGIFCTNCRIEFDNEDNYKAHYKSEFHEYNIKRRLASLSPITESEYNAKKAKTDTDLRHKMQTLNDYGKKYHCSDCNKKLSNIKTYEEHLKTNNHKKNSNKNKIKKDKINIFETETTKNNIGICLFCNKKFENGEKNLEHMDEYHVFSVTDKESCTNVDGVLLKINELIFDEKVCYHCGAQNFANGFSVQKHMTDMGHCCMNPDSMYLFDNYYDYTEANNKYIQEKIEKSKKYGNSNIININIAEENEEENNDNEWEDEDNSLSNNGDEENKKFIKIEGKIFDPKKKINYKQYQISGIKVLNTGELQMPDGRIIGHRMYKRLYNQKLKYKDTTKLSLLYKDRRTPLALSNNTKVSMYNSKTIIDIQRNNNFLKEKSKQLSKLNKHHNKIKLNRELKTKYKANKVLQPHFRDKNIVFG